MELLGLVIYCSSRGPAGCVYCFLYIHAVVHESSDQLDVYLWLYIPTHGADAEVCLAVDQTDGCAKRVEGAFVGSKRVVVVPPKSEVGCIPIPHTTRWGRLVKIKVCFT